MRHVGAAVSALLALGIAGCSVAALERPDRSVPTADVGAPPRDGSLPPDAAPSRDVASPDVPDATPTDTSVVDAGMFDAGASDAALEDAVADAGSGPEPPRIDVDRIEVARPRLTPCPTGWRTVTASATTSTCEPYPVGGPATCADDQAHFMGEAGCELIGPPCPTGEWADDLPAGRPILYVRAATTAPGNGSMSSPFPRIADAIAAVQQPQTVIALGKGDFDEVVSLPNSTTLWGACAAETRVFQTARSSSTPAIRIQAAGAGARNLSVLGPGGGIVVDGATARANLEAVIIDGAQNFGLFASSGALVVARSVVMRGLGPSASGANGMCLWLMSGGRVELARAVLERCRSRAVYADGSSSAALSDTWISSTQSQASDGASGNAVSVRRGSFVELERVLIERSRSLGISASGAGTRVRLRHAIIRDTEARSSDQRFGRGLEVSFGASAEIEATVIERNRYDGVASGGAGSTVTLRDVIVRDTRAEAATLILGSGVRGFDGAGLSLERVELRGNRGVALFINTGAQLDAADLTLADTLSDGSTGAGLWVESGATVIAERIEASNNSAIGVQIEGEGTGANLTGLICRDTSPDANGMFGRGINISDGATATITGALIANNRGLGVAVLGSGLNLHDSRVRSTSARNVDGLFGYGLAVQSARSALRRVVFEQNVAVSVFVGPTDSWLHATDVSVVDTESRGSDGRAGRGIYAINGGVITGERIAVINSREVGVFSRGAGSIISLREVEVRDTRAPACAPTSCPSDGLGLGVVASETASVTLDGFTIEENAAAGLQVAASAHLDVSHGVVASNPVGANIQVPGFDADRVTGDVDYHDNASDIDMSAMNVPTEL